MGDEQDAGGGDGAGHHFTGSNTRWLVSYLTNHQPAGTLDEVLARAGERRGVPVLSDEATWSTYAQFRALLEETADVLGGVDQLTGIGLHSFDALAIPDYTEVLHALGSPAAVYAECPSAVDALYPIVDCTAAEVTPTEWELTLRVRDAFEPFRAFCSYVNGLLAVTPRLFGFPPAEVTEVACQCGGSPTCVFRVRWEPTDEPTSRAEYWETRSMVLEARLDALQRTVLDLAGGDLPTVLGRIVSSAARAVQAPSFVLALESLPSTAERVYASGCDRATATRVARDLLDRDAPDDPSRLVVDVASATRGYGRLGAFRAEGSRFLPQERAVMRAYASLAASALDSAAALEEARALLDLSTALGEVATSDEMARKLADAALAVIGCDTAVVALVDEDKSVLRVTASAGLPAAVAAQLEGLTLPFDPEAVEDGLRTLDPRAVSDTVSHIFEMSGLDTVVSLPITCEEGVVGYVAAGVHHHPERLRESPDLDRRMRGLVAHAGTAIRNGRLLDRVQHQAMHDPLTGLPNRALILDRAEQMLARARRGQLPVAALFIDLDDFKNVNDTLGHPVGDELLRAVSARLDHGLRSADTVGRLGGDEFIVLAEGATLNGGADVLAARIHDVLREPFHIGGANPPLVISASIGIAAGPSGTAADLLRTADIALYRAKAAGKSCHVHFDPAMQSDVVRRIELEMDLRTMLPEQLFLLYQPIYDLASLQITGVEALLRWQHPTRGVVSPADFIPLLEQTGAIVDVGRWVLGAACKEVAGWRGAGHDLSLSVNVSVRQLEDDRLVSDVRDTLAATGLDPTALTIEVTETALMVDTQAITHRLAELKATGVRLAIDDFGTGYSSLAYVEQFPVDALKIDRSFISSMQASTGSAAIVRLLIELGHTLGLQTVAEGIETESQLAELQTHHCDAGQGFLLAQPLHPRKLHALLPNP